MPETDKVKERPRKRQTQSCDRCKFKKRKCDGLNPCSNCIKAKAECTMLIEQKKRGPKRPQDGNGDTPVVKRARRSSSMKTSAELQSPGSSNQYEAKSLQPSVSNSEEDDGSDYEEEVEEEMYMSSSLPREDNLKYESVFGTRNELKSDPEQQILNQLDESPIPALSNTNEFDQALLSTDSAFLQNYNTGLDPPLLENWLSCKECVLGRSNSKLSDKLRRHIVADVGMDGAKPKQFSNLVPDRLLIDPEILNLYSQINPKILSFSNNLNGFLQRDANGAVSIPTEAFLFGPVNLTIPELPGLPPELFLHLISMFFTYYHLTLPVIQETQFFENLIPLNKHHPMLLNTIYGIGCQYSRHPLLFQAPFYSPQKASEFFINRAFASVPPPDSKFFISPDSIGICQAATLLASTDLSIRQCRTWMMVGMAARLTQKLELEFNETKADFFSVFTGHSKTALSSTSEEKKRTLWGCLVMDMFVCLSTGIPMLLPESDYIDSFLHIQKLLNGTPASLLNVSNDPITPPATVSAGPRSMSGLGGSSSSSLTTDADRWKPYLSGFPRDTIFGATDLYSERWEQTTIGFFQVNHLYSKLDDTYHFMQLTFLVRKVLRFGINWRKSLSISKESLTPAVSCLLAVNDTTPSRETLHDSLILWYENLPTRFRVFLDLEAALSADVQTGKSAISFKEKERLSAYALMINLLFFATLSLVHHPFLVPETLDSNRPTFRLTSSLLAHKKFSSLEVVLLAYKAQCQLLRFVYGITPTASSIPPSEIASSPIISTLLMPPVFALLGHPLFVQRLMGQQPIQSVTMSNFSTPSFEPIQQFLIPTLINLVQLWPSSEKLVHHLFATGERVSKSLVQTQIPTANTNSLGNFVSNVSNSWMNFAGPDTGSLHQAQQATRQLSTNLSNLMTQNASNQIPALSTNISPVIPAPPVPLFSTPSPSSSFGPSTIVSPNASLGNVALNPSGSTQVDPIVSMLMGNDRKQPTSQISPVTNGVAATALLHNSNLTGKDTTSNRKVNPQQGIEKSWHDLRSEFEDEFLL